MDGRVRADGSGLFCPNCGNSASAAHEYCIHCGHDLSALQAVAGDATATSNPTRERTTATAGRRDEDADIETFRKRIRFLVSNGWDIEYDGYDEVVLADRGVGSIWIHVLLLMFTGGVGNLFYAWYHYSVDPARVTLRADGRDYEVLHPEHPKTETSEAVQRPKTSPRQFAGSLIFLVLGLIMIVTSELSVVPAAFGLAFVLVGLYVLPPVRRRIRNRHSPTTFGPTESVDKRYVKRTDRPCTVCGSRVVDGVVRDYEREYVFAGVPLYTMENGENYYCQDCQSVDATYRRESDRGLDTELDIDDESFTDDIERELEELRTGGADGSAVPDDAAGEQRERDRDA